uniref:Immunoglobulin subtype domain-containing protein n=1 Tax=Scophthalmus maximus TaxID=52904 RepID=A0A8D3E4G2_SCOMX
FSTLFLHSYKKDLLVLSVKAGDSITIPCPYDSEYTNRIKYLCQGNKWPYCSVAVKTNQPGRLGRFSISDDTKQRIFSVTVKDLYYTDTHFWCVVEIDWGKDVSRFKSFCYQDSHNTLLDFEVTGFNGDDITINCYHSNNGEGKWCRLGGDCVTTSSGSIAGARVNISARDHFFTVTMSGLTSESTGWYLCIKGDLQMPVHVNVTERSITSKCYNCKVGYIWS